MTAAEPRDETRAYRLEGRVQGVGFRWWTREQARELGVRGWVRNLRDGAVELHAAGPGTSLDELEGRLQRGPPGAAVGEVTRLEEAEDLPEEGFEIRRTSGWQW